MTDDNTAAPNSALSSPPPELLAPADDRQLSPAMLGWLLGSIVLAVLSFVVFKPILRDGWIRYDNMGLIYNEPMIKVFTYDANKPEEKPGTMKIISSGVRTIFSNYHHDLYQPLLTLSLAIDYAIFQRPPKDFAGATWANTDLTGWYYHSLAIHVVTIALLYLLMIRLTGHVLASFLGTAIVALHPLMVEPVSWLICRTFIVAGFWIVLGTHFYLSYARRPRFLTFIAYVFCYGWSFLGKPLLGIVVLPLLLDLWLRRRDWRRMLAEKVPVLAIAVAIVIVDQGRVSHMINLDKNFQQPGPAELAARGLMGLAWTAANTFVPKDLSVFYGPHEKAWGLFLSRSGLGAILIVAIWLIALGTWFRARRPELLLCAVAWGVLFLPQLAALPLRETVTSDRYNYVPLWFAGLGVASALAMLFGRRAELPPAHVAEAAVAPRGAAGALCILILLPVLWLLGSASRAYAVVWTDDTRLWERVVQRTPHRTAYGQLSNAILDRAQDLVRQNASDEQIDADFAYAEDAIRKGLELNPQDLIITQNWGGLSIRWANEWKRRAQKLTEAGDREGAQQAAAKQRERNQMAAEKYQEAVRINDQSPGGWNGLGVALMRTGRLEEARAAYNKAIALEKNFRSARTNLASALESLRKRAESAVQRDPSPQNTAALTELLTAEADNLAALGKQAEADALRARAISTVAAAEPVEVESVADPQDALKKAVDFLNQAREKAGAAERARGARDSAAMQTALAEQLQLAAQGEAYYRQALAAGLESADNWTGLGHCLMFQNNSPEAMEAYDKAVALDANFAPALAAWGRALAMQNRLDEAQPKLEAALAANPDHSGALLDLSKIYVGQKRYDDAIPLLERLHASDAANALYCNILRQLYDAQGRAADAAKLPCQPKK